VWGGEDEELEEIAAGNIYAKNWQAKAQAILEDTVCRIFFGRRTMTNPK
jgi:hypothetical protein